jgi:hypothetical protein
LSFRVESSNPTSDWPAFSPIRRPSGQLTGAKPARISSFEASSMGVWQPIGVPKGLCQQLCCREWGDREIWSKVIRDVSRKVGLGSDWSEFDAFSSMGPRMKILEALVQEGEETA